MPAYIRKYRVYQNSRPKKSISHQNNEYRRGALGRAAAYSFIYSTSYQTEHSPAASSSKAGTACSLTQGDACPGRSWEARSPRHSPLLYQQNKN